MAIKVKARQGDYSKSTKTTQANTATSCSPNCTELYISLKEQKVIREAALRSGVSRGVMQACWDAGKVYGLMVCRG